MREPTPEEWLDYHAMVNEARAMLRKDREGQYTQASIDAAKSAVKNANSWISALQR